MNRTTTADMTNAEVRADTAVKVARQLMKAADAHRAAARWLRQLGGKHTLAADRHTNQAHDLQDEAKTLREQAATHS